MNITKWVLPFYFHLKFRQSQSLIPPSFSLLFCKCCDAVPGLLHSRHAVSHKLTWGRISPLTCSNIGMFVLICNLIEWRSSCMLYIFLYCWMCFSSCLVQSKLIFDVDDSNTHWDGCLFFSDELILLSVYKGEDDKSLHLKLSGWS